MPLDLPKSYDATSIEADVYRRWEEAGCFKAGAGKKPGKPTYSIAIPPPNVTGVLHMGHALNNTLQDTLIRWRRMQGHDTLWQPGTDHAGIATESVVAKLVQESPEFLVELAAAGVTPENPPSAASKTPTGYDRDRFGRTAFLNAVWYFKGKSGGSIVKQLRTLGSSCDWSRERFTMDEGLSTAVKTLFVRLHQAGLIYRGMRMVNWCPVQKTALADDEVEHIEKQGHLWKLQYELADGSGSITVETTRPETFFGDTAVAVNPEDERYRHLIGKKVRLPIIGREIPIVGDEHADPAKGSGAVKITPAHDPNDYEVGKRHGLPLVRCIGFDGTMTAEAGPYVGQDRFVCRKQLLKDFEASGVLVGSTAITHAVGHSYRSNAPIEPMVTEQWFVNMAPLAEKALAVSRSGEVAFHPERWTKVYDHWLENVKDWCISRQIWWGHRIPAWHCAACGKATVAMDEPEHCAYCQATGLSQDPDVLDTWFSSALWPYSTLGWPNWEENAKQYYPTSTLVTDRGIIYFWVARMVMTGLFTTGKKPFSDVYIHGTVLDERGDKMSKSKGNGIDPLVMIQGGSQRYLGKDYTCPGYGADALRYTLLDMTTEGQDLKLSPAKFETGRNFANKVWNAGRFLLMNLSERPLAAPVTAAELEVATLGFTERWLLDRLATTVAECTAHLEAFHFNDYATTAYRFFRDDLCDWYVEWAKHQFKAGGQAAADATKVLSFAFEKTLRLLHPGMPFITEYLWQQVQTTLGGSAWSGHYLMTEAWPEPDAAHFSGNDRTPRSGFAEGEVHKVEETMILLREIVSAVRNARNLLNIVESDIAYIHFRGDLAMCRVLDENHTAFIQHFTDVGTLLFGSAFPVGAAHPAGGFVTVAGPLKLNIRLKRGTDTAPLKEKLIKRHAGLAKSIQGKESRLSNDDFIARAPAAQVEETRALVAKEQIELANLAETIAGL